MRNKTELSIVIATFNSAKLLPLVLQSIHKQTFPKSKIEILVVDGGSTDGTQSIAKKYGCKIIPNPKIVPAWAKYLGYNASVGEYLMFLDSDEVILNSNSIEMKLNVMRKNRIAHAVTGSGYVTPKGSIFVNEYINEYGDPFSYFFYHLTKDARFFIADMKKKYDVVFENSETVIFDFSKTEILPIFELVAMGSIVHLTYIRKEFPELDSNPGLLPHVFNLLVSKGSYIGIVKNDPLIHHSADNWNKYLGKITSRVINNIYTPAHEGFNGRVGFAKPPVQFKKYLFIPYAFSIILPFIDSIALSYSRKNIKYLLHVPLCLYTALLILYILARKKLGFTQALKSYGQEKVVGL